MDPSLANLTDPLAKIAAVGTAITVLTEVVKQYTPDDRVPPPLIAAVIAVLFTAAWEISLPTWPGWGDALGVVLLWFALFQVSIAVYHGATLSQKRRAKRRPAAAEPTVIHPPGVHG